MQARDVRALLPEVFQRSAQQNSPMATMLELMAQLFDPIETKLDQFPENLRADQADREYVFYLAQFMDLDRFFVQSSVGNQNIKQRNPEFSAGVAQLRQLIAHGPRLSRLRGTRDGLQLFLEVATGHTGFIIEENLSSPTGQPRPFHIRVTAPNTAHWFRDLVSRIVAAEKPAYTTSEIIFSAPSTAPEGPT